MPIPRFTVLISCCPWMLFPSRLSLHEQASQRQIRTHVSTRRSGALADCDVRHTCWHTTAESMGRSQRFPGWSRYRRALCRVVCSAAAEV
jgi:hypothetical protein